MVFADETGYLRAALGATLGVAVAALGEASMFVAISGLIWAIAGFGAAIVSESGRAARWLAAIGCLAAGFGLATWSFAASAEPSALEERIGEGRLRGVVRGVVVSGPEPLREGWGFEVRVETIDGEAAGAADRSVRFFLQGDPLGGGSSKDLPWPGDRIETFARLEQYPRQRFPGVPGNRWQMRSRDVASRAIVVDEVIQRTGRLKGPVWSLRRRLARSRIAYLRRVTEQLEPERAAYVLAMSAGARGLLADDQYAPFRRTGTAHLLAISGLHLGILAWMVWTVIGWLAGAFPRLLRRFGRRRVCAIPTLALLACYVWAIGAPISSVRAWLMVAAVAVARLTVRPVDSLYALATAMLAVLAWEPAQIASLGCHLSFSATFAILWFLRRRPPSLRPDVRPDADTGPWYRRLQKMATGTGVSLAATLATWPVLLAWNGAVPVDGLWTNLVVTPLASLCVVPVTFVGAALSMVWPAAGQWPLRWGGSGMEWLSVALAHVAEWPPHELVTGQLGPLATGLLAAGLLVVIGSRGRRRPLCSGTSLATIAIVVGLVSSGPPSGELRVHFIPVGQGDATLVELPDGRNLLVDAGGRRLGSDPGRRTVVPYLHRLGIGHLDGVIATHADIDHVGGLAAVAARMRPDIFLYHPVDGVPALDTVVGRMRDREAKLVRVDAERQLQVGRADVRVMRPAPSGGAGENDVSLVTRIDYAERRILLPGDIEAAGERWYLERCRAQVTCETDLLKVPHHGSATSSTARLLEAVEPEAAVVSAGKFNPFGHPADRVVARYHRRDIALLETARLGLVRIDIGTSGNMAVRTMRKE
jgi:competence protein ComEC